MKRKREKILAEIKALQEELEGMREKEKEKEQVGENTQSVVPDLSIEVLDHLPVGITIWGKDGDLQFCNTRFTEITGYTRPQIINLNNWFLLVYPDPEYRQSVLNDWQKSLHFDLSVRQFRITTRHGSEKEIEFRGSFLKNGQAIVTLADITDRKQKENQLKDSELLFRTLIESAHDAIMLMDRDKFLSCNDAGIKMFGCKSADELVGKGPWDFSPEYQPNGQTTLDRASDLIDKAYSEGPQEFEWKHKRVNGELFDAEVSLNKVSLGGKKLVQAIVRDITDRKRMEQGLRNSEEKYRHVINNSLEGIFVIQDGRFVFTNKAIERDTGYSSEELRSLKFMDFIHPDFRDKVARNHAKRLSGGQIPPYDLKIILGNKESLWVLLNATLIRWENEDAVLCFMTDIDKRKKAEEEIKESEERLRTLINSTPDIICFKDGHGRWLHANDADLELFSLTDIDYRGKTDLELSKYSHPIYKEAFETCHQTDEKAWKAKSITRDDEIIPRPDGSSRVYEVIKVPVFKPDGNRKALVVLGRDITDRKHAEKELLLAKEKAEESDRLKSVFLANMSHEIRTPMNGIMGFSELLKTPGLTGEEKDTYLEMIERSGRRMLNTINDLINISKIEAGQASLEMEDTNINKQLDYLFTFFKPQCEEKGLKLKLTKSLPDDKTEVTTDREKLYAILTNLIKNAVKFTQNGSIEFGYQKRKSEFEFFVKDTGIGIAADRQQAIFDRFVQADMEITRAHEGSGLGLSISKAYAEMLGGKLWLESEKGQGSKFYFTISGKPVREESTQAAEIKETNYQEGNQSGPRILIAEDDEISVQHLSIILRKIASELHIARNGEEAIRLAKEIPEIELILMDIKMPEADGYTATRTIREFNKDVIIIAQTAYALGGDRYKALEAGCNDYITKPVNKHELLAIIKKYTSQD